jgi:cytochrome c biogenesis protein ResB
MGEAPGNRTTAARVLITSVGRFLRSGRLIIAELVLIGVAAGVAVSLPQEPDADAVRRFAEAFPRLGGVLGGLGLHRILVAWWFLGAVGLSTASLVSVQLDQWRRVARLWRAPVALASFARAPYRRELPLPRHRTLPDEPVLATTGRISLLGSPVFHLGLLIVVLGGLGRLLWSSEAITRFVEGESIGPGPAVWDGERRGWLGTAVTPALPIQLLSLDVERHPSGALRWIACQVAVGGGSPRAVAVNDPLDVGDLQLTISGSHGLVALLERRSAGTSSPVPVWLEFVDGGAKGRVELGGGLELRLRASDAGGRPSALEIRVTRGGALVFAGTQALGGSVPLGADDALRLVALPYWVQAQVARDRSRPVFYVGLIVALLGVTIMFGVVRIDAAVYREGDRLIVAMRPQRFAPLYVERFEALCREWTG